MAGLRVALDPGEAVRQLDAVSVEQPLAARLVAVITIMDAYYERARRGFDDIQRSAGRRAAPDTPSSFTRDDFRAIGSLPETSQAVTRLLTPDQANLRLPPDVLAEAFLGISLGAARAPHPDRTPLPAGQLVDLFLHGADTRPETAESPSR
ncbi:hypothetical protein [Paractinoplanes globisporus]|uniref:TetR family transcriptional regulator n=1 Tax=Paractinoplanes globisporus TaxID=113565 RepID=A0ABW6WUF3_9ACTN|nr:hypothetical protein [Actinoplanes globisporus]